ncbi:vesicular mannose-binding lectin [Anaeramoeba flamelloides]|uniref:Vesicular mannose-binding lectin n=1 Tax=Anaeramoeba flamelloides TaxID=1746091 RepID=A0AAV7ZFH5_9EUKA|nr:vesicular mannose-binding lectin [Anaeramoeba flamelloides]
MKIISLKSKFSLTLLFLIICSQLFFSNFVVTGFLQTSSYTHSFGPPFLGTLRHYELGENALFLSDSVSLTSNTKSQRGSLWGKVKNSFKSWEAEIHFKITGHSKMGAEGFAFWYTKERLQTGPVFGNKNKFDGLGVFFDSFDNNGNKDNPFIQVMLGNGKIEYEHIKDGSTTSLGQCPAQFRNTKEPAKVKIIYQNDELTILTDFTDSGIFQNCLVLQNVDLPTENYFGFSAETGFLSDNHELIRFNLKGLSTNSNYKQQPKTTGKTDNIIQNNIKRGKINEKQEKEPEEEEEKVKEKIQNEKNKIEDLKKILTEKQLNGMLENLIEQNKLIETYVFDINDLKNIYQKDPDMNKVENLVKNLQEKMTQNKNEIDSIRSDVLNLRDKLVNQVLKKNKEISQQLKDYSISFNRLRSDVRSILKSQQHTQTKLESETEVIHHQFRKKTNMKFWIFFGFSQLLFILFIIYWLRSQKQRTKLL